MVQCFLDVAVHRQPNRPDEDLAYCFDGESGLRIAAAPALPQEFVLELEFRLELDTGGFLFSKAATRASRFFALEALEGQHGLVLYFRTQGSEEEARSPFPDIIVNDARRHRLVITVSLVGISIEQIVIQGSQARNTSVFVAIPAPLDDCGFPAVDCETNVGRHLDGSAINGCFYGACIRHVGQFVTGATITSTTTTTAFQSIELLERSVHQQPNMPDEDFAYCFDGTAGLFIAGAPWLPSSFNLLFETVVTAGATGYLFSQSHFGGTQNFGVFVSTDGLRVSYQTVANGLGSVLVPDAVINDGVRHILSIQLQDASLAVELDGAVVFSLENGLLAGLAPCNSGYGQDCVVFVAQTQHREDIEALHGCFFRAELNFAGAFRESELAFELLDPAHHDGAVESAGSDNRYCFNGTGVELQPLLPRASSIFSISMRTLFLSDASG